MGRAPTRKWRTLFVESRRLSIGDGVKERLRTLRSYQNLGAINWGGTDNSIPGPNLEWDTADLNIKLSWEWASDSGFEDMRSCNGSSACSTPSSDVSGQIESEEQEEVKVFLTGDIFIEIESPNDHSAAKYG